MAIGPTGRPSKNIWIAASDGDLERVQYLIETEGMSPNVPDENTYTPIHAAASYAHLELLEYLLSKGGNINITDEDGETPLFTVETEETARWLVDRGARPEIKNGEGQTAAEFLFEDHPEVAIYLQSLVISVDPAALSNLPGLNLPNSSAPPTDTDIPAELTEDMTDSLMVQTDEIMRSAEETGDDPEMRLRQAVGSAVLNGWGQLGGPASQAEESSGGNERDSKRSRRDEEAI